MSKHSKERDKEILEFNFLFDFFKKVIRACGFLYESGDISVASSGVTKIKILTKFTPSKVWISPKHTSGVPSCGGNLDLFDVYIVPDGFVLVVSLQSDSREFEWVAEG